MYENIGSKIKSVGAVLCWLGIIISIIGGVIIIVSGNNASLPQGFTGGVTLYGILIIVLGSISSFIYGWLMVGFGDLIETSAITAGKLNKIQIQLRQMQDKIEKTEYER